jgi:2',3'-cyclic-nucleotide 2'-phosphodiesterase (5'-nucleotidase family)
METTIWNKDGQPRLNRKGVTQAIAVSLSLLGLAVILSAASPRTVSADAGRTATEGIETEGAILQEVSTADVRTAETDAGNLVADAVRLIAGADVGFVPAAAFKPGTTAPRPAPAEQIATLVEPSSDIIVVMNLKGDQILAALERSVSYAPQPSAGFLQVSGITFSYDAKKPSQSRVSNVTIGGRNLDRNSTYKVATTRPLGNGQQGYYQVWNRNAIASDTNKSLAAAISEYASRQGGSLSGRIDGRVKAL